MLLSKELSRFQFSQVVQLIVKRLFVYFQQNKNQIMLFGMIGLITFFLDFSLVWLFYGLIKLDYRFAVSLAYIVTVITHFYLNRTFTYKAKGISVFSHMVKYGLMLLINYLITLSISIFTVEVLKLSPYFGVVFATGTIMVFNFLLMKYYVFNNKG